MNQPHSSEPIVPVVVGLFIVLVTGPVVLSDPVIAALTATQLRQAVSVVFFGGLFAGWSLWLTPGISVRGSAADERSISNETSQPTDSATTEPGP